MAAMLGLVSKGGRVVVTAVAPLAGTSVTMSLFELTSWQKELRGTLFGAANGRVEIPNLLRLYAAGQLYLDEMVTRRYALDEINEGYRDLHAGRNIRGVIALDHA